MKYDLHWWKPENLKIAEKKALDTKNFNKYINNPLILKNKAFSFRTILLMRV